MMINKVFDPEQQKHWPVLWAYQDKNISRAQAAAQLKDLGCVDWEIKLYLDNDQSCGGDDE